MLVEEGTKKSAYLGVTYMVAFVAFGSIQNMISQIYKQNGLEWIGILSLVFVYFSFALGSFTINSMLPRLGYRMTIILGLSSVFVFNLTGLLIGSCEGGSFNGLCRPGIIAATSFVLACNCGYWCNALWVTQSCYMIKISSAQNRPQIFSTFTFYCNFSQVFGNLGGAVLLALFSHFTYFLIMCAISVVAVYLAFGVEDFEFEDKNVPIGKSIQAICSFFREENTERIKVFASTSLTNTTFVLVVSKVIFTILQGDPSVNAKTSAALTCFGLCLAFTSYFITKADKVCPYQFNVYANTCIMTNLLLFILSLLFKSFILALAGCMVLGVSENLVQMSNNVIIGLEEKDLVRGYGVFRFLFAMGCSTLLLTNLALTQLGLQNFFLGLLLAAQLYVRPIVVRWNEAKSSTSKELLL